MATLDALCRARQAAAATYPSMAFMQWKSCQHLLERLSFVKLNPKKLLILGAQLPPLISALQQRFAHTDITVCDISENVLQHIKSAIPASPSLNHHLLNPNHWDLPLDHYDLIISPLFIHWLPAELDIFLRLRLLLTEQGYLFFNAYGPNTFQSILAKPAFMDMHLLGDALLQAKLRDPVVDVERLQARYDSVDEIHQDLQALGYNLLLTTQSPKDLKLDYEFIYGHALGASLTADNTADEYGEVHIGLEQLRQQLRRS